MTRLQSPRFLCVLSGISSRPPRFKILSKTEKAKAHTLRPDELPLHHHHPFDRMIIAQAIAEDRTGTTSYRIFGKYPEEILWCG
jgi:PIN domain nuclease of toxin-antitoxin system